MGTVSGLDLRVWRGVGSEKGLGELVIRGRMIMHGVK